MPAIASRAADPHTCRHRAGGRPMHSVRKLVAKHDKS
jgi:hypothetical protein